MALRGSTGSCDQGALLGYTGSLICRSGCLGTLGDMNIYCTDFSESEDWVSGERTYGVDVGASTTSFEASLVTSLLSRIN